MFLKPGIIIELQATLYSIMKLYGSVSKTRFIETQSQQTRWSKQRSIVAKLWPISKANYNHSSIRNPLPS